jgi:hypothetical protein
MPPRKANGTLYLKDDRQGAFQLSWYENRQKRWQNVNGRVSEHELPFLSDAITQAEDESWFLNNRDRRVHDPTTDVVERKKLSVEVSRYIEAKSGCKKTVSAHEHAVREFLAWAKEPKKGRGGETITALTSKAHKPGKYNAPQKRVGAEVPDVVDSPLRLAWRFR